MSKSQAKSRKMRQDPHLCLKWKIVIILGSILLSIHGILSGITIATLQRQYKEQRIESHERYKKTIELLISQSSRLLQQIAETIPLFSENIHHNRNNEDHIVDTLNNYWSAFQLTWGVEGIQYLDRNGRTIETWGSRSIKENNFSEIRKILDTEKPLFFIQCHKSCLQYIGIPILDGNGTNKVLIISKSLADIVLDFNTITHTQIGILTNNLKSGKKTYWGHHLDAITNPLKNKEILRSTETEFSLNTLKSSIKNLQLHGNTYEIKAFDIPGVEGQEPTFIVIDDITKIYLSQRQNTFNHVANGGISLAIGMMLLLLLLRKPLQRVTNLSRILPMLAEGRYISVRNSLLHHNNTLLLGNDEIDYLVKSVLQLSYKLEDLQTERDKSAQDLKKQHRILEKERNFSQELLDSAPLIILTQSFSGEIITINQYGKHILEKTPFKSRAFEELFLGDKPDDINAKYILLDIRNNKISKAQFESQLNLSDSQPRYITWFHTRLNHFGSESPLILSIGLDITDRKIAEDRLKWLANHDPLTNLYNRRKFQQEFNIILHKSLKKNQPGAILYFDLDQFKYVNDTSGHQAGDALLQRIANKIKHVTRSTDLIARLGGDEFALVIQNTNQFDAIQIAEKLFNSIHSIDYKVNEHPFKITVSIGIAMFPEHGHNIQDLLANADLAMYQSKESGRGRIHLYSPNSDFQYKLKSQVYWKDQIERALADDRFVLYYQPILDIQENKISHYETLLRMVDEQNNIVSPGQFIPIAEQVGLISHIDHMVIKKALDTHKLLCEQGLAITLSINLSGHALSDLKLQRWICDALSNDQIDPSLIIFEITETIAVSNFSSAQKMMKEIRSRGCKFAIDDFGVGFSSFYYLMHLPVDYVKIDGSFIKEILHSKEDQVLVHALADIAKGLGKKTIAEFVENGEILSKLKSYGIDYAQGYYIGKPSEQISLSSDLTEI